MGQSNFTVGYAVERRTRRGPFLPGTDRSNGFQVACALFHRRIGFSTQRQGEEASLLLLEGGAHLEQQLRSTMFLATFSIVETPSTGNEASTFLSDRKQLLRSFNNRFEAASYPLLVLVCGLLSTKDYTTLCPLLWSNSLADSDPKVLAPVRSDVSLTLTSTDPLSDVLSSYAVR
jgi:hypothetical protein